MIFEELSNAFFRFSLRQLEAEIEGGVFKHPPIRSWKIQTAIRARVNKYVRNFYGHFLSRVKNEVTRGQRRSNFSKIFQNPDMRPDITL